MTKLILIHFALIFSLLNTSLHAQTGHAEHDNEHNYVVLTRKVPQLKPILKAAEELALQDAEKFGDFQVVLCGKGVQDLIKTEKMSSFLRTAQEIGVIINACGFSLKKFEVDKSQLPPAIKVVENGILHNLELQKKGYLSVEL